MLMAGVCREVFCSVQCLLFVPAVRDRQRTKMERDILADLDHPFIVRLHYGLFFSSSLSACPSFLSLLGRAVCRPDFFSLFFALFHISISSTSPPKPDSTPRPKFGVRVIFNCKELRQHFSEIC